MPPNAWALRIEGKGIDFGQLLERVGRGGRSRRQYGSDIQVQGGANPERNPRLARWPCTREVARTFEQLRRRPPQWADRAPVQPVEPLEQTDPHTESNAWQCGCRSQGHRHVGAQRGVETAVTTCGERHAELLPKRSMSRPPSWAGRSKNRGAAQRHAGRAEFGLDASTVARSARALGADLRRWRWWMATRCSNAQRPIRNPAPRPWPRPLLRQEPIEWLHTSWSAFVPDSCIEAVVVVALAAAAGLSHAQVAGSRSGWYCRESRWRMRGCSVGRCTRSLKPVGWRSISAGCDRVEIRQVHGPGRNMLACG